MVIITLSSGSKCLMIV